MEPNVLTKWNLGPEARKLLRLYLSWPKRFQAEEEEEARLFHGWLQENYQFMRFVSVLGVADVQEFLAVNPRVIEAAKFLKPAEHKPEGFRLEKRITTATKAFLSVYDCAKKAALIGQTLKGTVTDVTSNGLGIEVVEGLPEGSIINLTVAPSGYPIRLYRLTGEVRWLELDDGLYQIGVQILDMDDAGTWRSDFIQRFKGSEYVSG